MMCGVQLERVKVVRDVDVWLDSKVSFRVHYESMILKAKRAIDFICRAIKPFKQTRSIIILCTALVKSILVYCSVIWSSVYADMIQKRY